MAVPCCPVHHRHGCDDDDDAEMEKRVDTGDISVLIFFSCANFLAAYPQTNYKHCAVLDCAKSN